MVRVGKKGENGLERDNNNMLFCMHKTLTGTIFRCKVIQILNPISIFFLQF